MSDEKSYSAAVVLYAVPIQEAARSGDRERMSKMEAQAQQYVSEVESALAELRKAMGNS
jgi:hypothetical protein